MPVTEPPAAAGSPTPAPASCCDGDLAERYDRFRAHVVARFEREALGSNHGADGYTTRAQADDLATHLSLTPVDRLLDLGAGAGWPGSYLCEQTGCFLVSTDDLDGVLGTARTRAAAAGWHTRADARMTHARANGRNLPFTAASFGAIVHGDVLCCLRPKLAVLRECRRVLHRSGRMAFTVIHPAPALAPAAHRRALRCGPPHVSVRGSTYPALLGAAGFGDVRGIDVTDEYRATLARKLEIEAAHAAELAHEWGQDCVDTLREARTANIAAVDDGLLQRTLFVARPAG